MTFQKNMLTLACLGALGVSSAAYADDVSDLKAQMEVLQKQLDTVKTQLYNMQQRKGRRRRRRPPQAWARPFVQLKPDSGLTFLVPGGGEVQLYGNLDVSFDYTTKGLKSDYGENGGMPVGKMGWEPAIATNLSNLGARGKHPLQTRSRFRLAAGSGHRHFRNARDQGIDVEHERSPSTARCSRGTALSASPARTGAASGSASRRRRTRLRPIP